MEFEGEEGRPQYLWETLPTELLVIVLRDEDLPVFTLAECRLVCKRWKYIIDGPELRHKIWNKEVLLYDASFANSIYFCFHDRWIRRYITFGLKQVVAAHGGLLCFSEILSTEFVMFNPVSDKFLILNVPHEVDGLPTVFDGKLECIMLGLVVDQSTKHFKLVLGGVLFPDRRRSLIYNSTTSTWSWIIDQFPTLLNWLEVECKEEKGEFCNGCLYWLVFDPTSLIRALLIFDLSEERWNIMAEEVMEDTSHDLHITAYEGHLCLIALNWSNYEFGRSYDGNFLRHPMVRRMDESLIRSTRHLWVWEAEIPFKIYGAGGSDLFFVFDVFEVIELQVDNGFIDVATFASEIEGEYEFLEVARYWSETDLMELLPEVPHPDRWEDGEWARDGMMDTFRNAYFAIIPAPGVNPEQEWITQQQRHL